MTSIRTILALAAANQWPFYQIDVKNAFLNGDLSEVVYMQPPPDVIAPLDIYADFDGLFMVLNMLLVLGMSVSTNISFMLITQSMANYAMFRRIPLQGIVLLILYVYDMIITGSDLAVVASLT